MSRYDESGNPLPDPEIYPVACPLSPCIGYDETLVISALPGSRVICGSCGGLITAAL